MKFKTTNKEIKNGYYYIVRVGYCDLQNLLSGCDAFAYTSGVYGWNANFFDVDGICICTGYRSLVGENIDYNIIRKYEKKAEAIRNRYNYTEYKKEKAALNRLRLKFAEEVRSILKQQSGGGFSSVNADGQTVTIPERQIYHRIKRKEV